MTARSFVYLTFGCILSFSIGIAGFNYLTDPFLIFGSKRIEGFNYFKTEINNYVSLSKAYHPLHIPNEALILGNSRVEMGIDPDHECFDELGRVYNLGIPGQGVANQAAYAMNLIRQQPIRHIFWGLDFTDFLSTEQSISSLPLLPVKIGNSRLKYYMEGSLNDDYSVEKIKSYYKALFSLDALTRA